MKSVLVSIAGLVVVSSAQAATMDLLASADGHVQRNAVEFIVTDDSERVSTLRSGGNNVINGVYEFDLSALPSGATITGVSLKVTTAQLISNTGPEAPITFSAFTGDGLINETDHELNTTGTEIGTETYATGGSGPAVGTLLMIDFDTVVPFQTAYDDISDFVTVRSQTVNFVNFGVHSLDTTTSGVLLPTLSVEYVPEPSSLMLLSLVGLLIRRR